MDNNNEGNSLRKFAGIRKFMSSSSYGLAVNVSVLFLLSAAFVLIMTKSSSFVSPVFLRFNNPFSSNSFLVSSSISNPNNTHVGNGNQNNTLLENPDLTVKNGSIIAGSEHRNSSFGIGKNSSMERKDECDIYDGKWEKDYTLPHYPPGSCPLIDRAFNCRGNGRPDQGFYSWRWQPNACNIPRLNASDFLERLKGKRLVFVGDSLNRNMWESLVCILRHSIPNKERVYEISGRKEFKKEGFGSFRFEDFNCSIDYVTSPFLVRPSKYSKKKVSFPTLRLDLMDKSTGIYNDADVLVFNTGHWWSHEKTSKGENYYQEGEHVYDKLDGIEAYRKALTTWGEWVDSHVDTNKTLVFFRGYSIAHFSGGEWNSGGQCHREREPNMNGSYIWTYPPKMTALESVLNEMKTPVIYLNVTRMTDTRKDAHPSIYRKSHKNAEELIQAEKSQDCSHWCLPGVPDIWNELLYVSLLKLGFGSQ